MLYNRKIKDKSYNFMGVPDISDIQKICKTMNFEESCKVARPWLSAALHG